MRKLKIGYDLTNIESYGAVGLLTNSNISKEDSEKYKKVLDSFNEIMEQEIKDGKITSGKLEITLDNCDVSKEHSDFL
ncbi:hypothetical protein CMI39_00835 [Candidatus Pacearchaeota archaeon]|jgi:hypothetical protein|nr:hypothetical protein [Candidatus Pacearchaeota archaeon]|tara:strand:+ start:25709 stop:25942 length:234 start_codon:yes stop_codon:yes gene_type:complete